MDDKPESSFIFLAKRLEYVPRYAMDYFFGLLAAIVSDVTITTIALAAVALGLAVGHWLLVVAFFFTLYSLLRIISIVANAIGSTGQVMAQNMRMSQPPTVFQGGNQLPPSPSVVNSPVEGGEVEPPPLQDNGQRIPVTFPTNNG